MPKIEIINKTKTRDLSIKNVGSNVFVTNR